MAKARAFTEADRPAALTALAAALARMRVAGREGAQHFCSDMNKLIDGLLDECAVVIVGDYFVAFQVAEGWFTDDTTYLDEVLVMRITRTVGNTLRNVVRELERLARLNGCAGMYVGTYGTADPRLARVYRKLGFKDAPAQLYKEF